MRFYLPLLLIFVLGTCLRAQSTDVPAPKFSVQQYGKKSFRAAGQRIYVAGFNVHYQTFFSVRDAQAAKRDRAGSRAISNVALGGLTEADLRGMTDELYAHFTEQLTAAGYTFIAPATAREIPTFAGYTEVPGGSISPAQLYGYVTVTPGELPTYVPGVKNSGKRKQKFIDPSARISGDLNEAIVAFVDVYVPFAEDGESSWSRSLGRMTDESKAVVKTNLRLGMPTIAAKGNFAESVGLGQRPGVQGRGVRLAAGKMKVGLGALAGFTATLKKDLPIEGVMRSEKFKTYARGEAASPFATGVYFLSSEEVEETRGVDYDREAYLRSVVAAGRVYLETAVGEFLDGVK